VKAPRSIRWRLQLWYGVLFAVVLAGLGLAAREVVEKEMAIRTDKETYRLAFALNGATRGPRPPPPGNGPRGGPPSPRSRVDWARLDHVLSPGDRARGFYYAVWRKNDPPYFQASANAPAGLPQPSEHADGFRSRGDLREAFIISNPGDCALVGRSLAEEKRELSELEWQIAGGAVALWAAVMAIGWWLVGQALRPVGAISDAAERIAGGDLSRRISDVDPESELGRLADVLNDTFSRLEAAFARQKSFTADAAHELRTPVTVLLTHLQNVLEADDLAGENREALEACQRAAQRMRRLIESLLQLARFDGGQEQFHRMPCDLAVIAREALELTEPLAELRGVVLHRDLASASCGGDPDRLAQVVTNLLSNAIHYTVENGEVRVATRREGRQAVCVVSNTGPGIPAEGLPHIFERFYRADRARTTNAGRTGLGLAISQAIVQAHGGTIEARSEVDGETVFTVRLPGGDQAPR
jgi:heavy metal sensor kinase